MSIFGGAKHLSLSSDLTLSLGEPRVLAFTVGAGITVTLPPATTPGGPYFYIFSVGGHGDHDFTLKDSAGTFSDTVEVDTLVTLIVGDDGTWQRAQRTDGILQRDSIPTAFGYVASGAAPFGSPWPTSGLRSYNYLVNTWVDRGFTPLPGGNGIGNAFAGLDSRIYNTGSWSGGGAWARNQQVFSPAGLTWSLTTDRTGTYEAYQAASADSKVYYFTSITGTPIEYDPSTDTWDETWNDPEHPHIFGAGVAYNNLIYLYGGADRSGAGAYSDVTKKINSFDPDAGAGGTWTTGLTDSTEAGMMNIGSAEHGGILYFAGGCPLSANFLRDTENPVKKHHSYSVSTGNWTTETELTRADWGKGAFSGLGDDQVYWIGGANGNTGVWYGFFVTVSADVQSYNTSTKAWSTTPTDWPTYGGHYTAGIAGVSNSTVSAAPF